MSCHGGNRKRTAIIAGAVAGAAGVITYVSLAANPVAAAALPVVLAFAACPAMCAAMGGIMWLNHRMSKKKKNKTIKMLQQQQGEPRQTIEHQQPEEKTKDREIQQGSHCKQREMGIVGMVPYPQKQRKKKAKQDTDTGIT
jgi:Na+/melibiose symporter-like transporter